MRTKLFGLLLLVPCIAKADGSLNAFESIPLAIALGLLCIVLFFVMVLSTIVGNKKISLVTSIITLFICIIGAWGSDVGVGHIMYTLYYWGAIIVLNISLQRYGKLNLRDIIIIVATSIVGQYVELHFLARKYADAWFMSSMHLVSFTLMLGLILIFISTKKDQKEISTT